MPQCEPYPSSYPWRDCPEGKNLSGFSAEVIVTTAAGLANCADRGLDVGFIAAFCRRNQFADFSLELIAGLLEPGRIRINHWQRSAFLAGCARIETIPGQLGQRLKISGIARHHGRIERNSSR